MIEIKIPKEITEYKEKFLFGLTIRQCVCAAAALAICVPLYIFGKDWLGDDLVGWIVILTALPILAFSSMTVCPLSSLSVCFIGRNGLSRRNESMRSCLSFGAVVMK